QLLWVEPCGQGGGLHQITKQHSKLAAFGLRGTGLGHRDAALGHGLCLADGQLGKLEDGKCWRRGRCRVACPAQAATGVLDDLRMGVEEFVREDRHLVVVQRELELQRVIGHPAALLEEGHDLVEYGINIHHSSSAWGSRKVISMERYTGVSTR